MQRQRVWDARLREEEGERHVKVGRSMAEEIASLRRELLDQHRNLATQVDEQISRLRQVEHLRASYSPRPHHPPPHHPPPNNPSSAAGYSLAPHSLAPHTADRGSSSGASYVGQPHYAPPPPPPQPGTEAYEAAAREALRELTGGAGPPPGAGRGAAGDEVGERDELDKLLLDFLSHGADMRGS